MMTCAILEGQETLRDLAQLPRLIPNVETVDDANAVPAAVRVLEEAMIVAAGRPRRHDLDGRATAKSVSGDVGVPVGHSTPGYKKEPRSPARRTCRKVSTMMMTKTTTDIALA